MMGDPPVPQVGPPLEPRDESLSKNPLSRIDTLAAFADAFWAHPGILREPAWRQRRLFLRCAVGILSPGVGVPGRTGTPSRKAIP